LRWSVAKWKAKRDVEFSTNFQQGFDLGFCEFFGSPGFIGVVVAMQALPDLK